MLRNKFYIGMVLGTLSIVPACNIASKAEKPLEVVLVNVLEEKYFRDCHIKIDASTFDTTRIVSINIPFERVLEDAVRQVQQKNWDKNSTEIIVYCANYTCTASAAAAEMLIKEGFKHVIAFEGGAAEALHAGIAMDGPCEEKYLDEYKKPTEEQPSHVPTISVEDLKKKLAEFERKQ